MDYLDKNTPDDISTRATQAVNMAQGAAQNRFGSAASAAGAAQQAMGGGAAQQAMPGAAQQGMGGGAAAASAVDTPKKAKAAKKKDKAAKKAKSRKGADEEKPLNKLKKNELLQIMLAQGEEIDALRARVAELEAQLANREFNLQKVGSIAQASLQVTEIFREAEKAAAIYLENIRRRYE